VTEERERRKTSTRKRSVNLLHTISLLGSAIALVKELRLPKEDRTWHGSIGGLVPYDLRRPTLARTKERVWAPDSPHIFSARVFGAGWTLNLGRLYTLARQRLNP
jgi:hypothetical protein